MLEAIKTNVAIHINGTINPLIAVARAKDHKTNAIQNLPRTAFVLHIHGNFQYIILCH